MNINEKIANVEEAQEKLYEAIALLKEAVGKDGYTRSYLIDKLEIMAGENHGFLSRDLNCDKVIQKLKEGDEE